MSSGIESPQSVSTVVYYKGFSTTITRREKDVDIMPMVDAQLADIDKLIELGCEPSWNVDANNKRKLVAPTNTLSREPVCETCGAAAIEKQGTNKLGKPYHAIFCSSEIKSHTKWM